MQSGFKLKKEDWIERIGQALETDEKVRQPLQKKSKETTNEGKVKSLKNAMAERLNRIITD